ncbi:LCP family protein [Streptomyces sp. SID13666]|uniref:LytR C-terminal domain-containing protein n=1 Tax=unclassified Streptomyces TaxID=2593676 RepID=UPI0013C25655|nr:LCP family protein [Streptomyces sp. SID13666]NEA71597.1 LCP family protein [Streptomyces sp. SID13588]
MNDANPRWQYAEGGPENGQDPNAPQDPPAPQDPYYQQQYGYDPYAQQPEQQPRQQQPPQQQPGYADPYYADPAQTYAGQQQGWIPQQQPYPDPQYAQPQPLQQPPYQDPQYQQQPQYGAPPAQPYYAAPAPVPAQVPGPDAGPPRQQAGQDYRTEQFAFVDEDDEESEEVIDWLKFSESRTERRAETKRRGRKRKIALVLLVVVALVGGAGYLWKTGRIPGLGGSGKNTAAAGAGGQKRDVIVVNLRPVDGSESSTALLVSNQTTGKGTTVLLPNTLALSTDDGGSTTLGKQIDQGQEPTRQGLNTLLGSDIKGSWRLDTPYLEILVESLGGITLDTDTAVNGTQKDAGKVLVTQGKAQELNGQGAVAYATHRGPGEAQAKQLIRFGQVMQAVLAKMPSDSASATKTVEALNSIPDPSLPVNALGASLAQLAEQAKTGTYSTALLPVQPNGTLSAQATESVVKDVLGGTVKNAGASAQARVLIKDASGDKKAAGLAQAAILNGGVYTYVAGGTAPSSQPASEVLYADDARKAAAADVAKTLGLPAGAVKKGTVAANADITVVLGKDYKG